MKNWKGEFDQLTMSISEDLFIHFSDSLVLFAKVKCNEFEGKNPGNITLGMEMEALYSLTPVF